MKKISSLFFLSCLFLLSTIFPAWAEETKTKSEQSTFVLDVKDNLINLQAKQASFKEILKHLEKEIDIKVNIFDGVDDKKVTLNIADLPVYAIHTLLEKMKIENFAVVYDGELASKVIYILPEGKDIAEVIRGEKDKVIIKPARFADAKNISQIKGHEIVKIIKLNFDNFMISLK